MKIIKFFCYWGIFFNTITGGSATHSLENNGTISGGGGGGGSGGGRQGKNAIDDGQSVCGGTTFFGSAGAVGALGQSGGTGVNASIPPADGDCSINPQPGTGGAGGDSIDKNGRTVTQTGTGTYNGTQRAWRY